MKRIVFIIIMLMIPASAWAPPGGAGFAFPTFYLDTDNYYKPFDSTMGIAVGGTAITLDAAGTAEIGGTITLLGPITASGIAGTADWYIKLAADGTASIGDPSGGTVNSFKTWAYAGTTIVADSTTDTVTLIAGNGMGIAMSPGGDSVTLTATAGGVSSAFKTITGDAGTSAVADSSTDTLNITGNTGVTTTGDSSTDTIDISLEATLVDILDGTIAENLVNTDNPWADNEVADNITVDDAGIAATIMRDSEWTAATLTAPGKSELATTTETITGTDATRAVTPDGLTDAMAAASQPLEATLTDIADGTINENLVNTANPWAVNEGGTGAGTLNDGFVLLGSGTGAITPLDLTTDGAFLVGDGTTDPVAESGATLRTSIGVAIGSDVQAYDATLADLAAAPLTEAESIGDAALPTAASFNAVTSTTIELGHATDTTLSRASAGDINIEGNIAYRSGGTDVPVTDGGTGASTAAAARANLEVSSPIDSVVIAGSSLTVKTYRMGKANEAYTITDIHCITDIGTVIIELMEQDATGASGATVDAPITCDSNGAEDDGTLTNGTIDAADWLAARIGTEESSPTDVTITWYGTID